MKELFHHQYVRALTVIASLAGVSAIVASTADAAHPASRAQKRAISQDPGLLKNGNGQASGDLGRIAWAVVSTRGPYAIVSVVPRPHRSFQGGVVLMHRTPGGWRIEAGGLIDDPCNSVPRRVIRDLHTYFVRHPRYHVINRAFRTSPSCAGRLARGD